MGTSAGERGRRNRQIYPILGASEATRTKRARKKKQRDISHHGSLRSDENKESEAEERSSPMQRGALRKKLLSRRSGRRSPRAEPPASPRGKGGRPPSSYLSYL